MFQVYLTRVVVPRVLRGAQIHEGSEKTILFWSGRDGRHLGFVCHKTLKRGCLHLFSSNSLIETKEMTKALQQFQFETIKFILVSAKYEHIKCDTLTRKNGVSL